MRCPFLREAQVKFCLASAFRKMILRTPSETTEERCSSPDYVTCLAAKEHHEEHPSRMHCPFLQESLVQYCSAAPVTRFIPYTDSPLSHCGTESHRYCELFLTLAPPCSPPARKSAAAPPGDAGWTTVEGVELPLWLQYAPNHMWLDKGEDGSCHIGVDAFLAKLLGRVEKLSFVSSRSVDRPETVLTVKGVDLRMTFPDRLAIREANSCLRAHPDRIISNPYTLGWLYEGTTPVAEGAAWESGLPLFSGETAARWMKEEIRRLFNFVHTKAAARQPLLGSLMTDGGILVEGLLQQLTHGDILALFNDFFSLNAGRKTP